MASYNISPPIFADLILDTEDGQIVLDVEQPDWLKRAQELQPNVRCAGLIMRGTDEIKVWLMTHGKPFEYFSRVTGRISLNDHTQERKACLRVGDTEGWLDASGNVEMRKVEQ